MIRPSCTSRQLHFTTILIIGFFIVVACRNHNANTRKQKLFTLVRPASSGVTFKNTLTESDTFNYFLYPYMYMGGGVSAADFNGDGLTDIFFTGNMVSNRLYINKGDFEFDDATAISNIAGNGQWMLGSTVCDINDDGLLDIYVSVSGLKDNCRNLLFINQGNNAGGIPVFSEEAAKYGIDDNGKSTQGTFFDYDNDGDLDLYVANYPITKFKSPAFFYKQMMRHAQMHESSHLYRNNGNGTFTDVTKEAGLLNFGLSLSATISDLNLDGYKDIYVSNDFTSPDFFFMNNGDGTFTDRTGEIAGQTSFYGMGADIADYNNDGYPDIMQIDMAPEDNLRSKENMTPMSVEEFGEMIQEGLHHQYRYSTLQLNRGIAESGLPWFSNAAWMAGVTSTDWSWGALFADLDLDGWKDLIVSNGIRRDINNIDFFNEMAETEQQKGRLTNKELLEMVYAMPYFPLINYLYKNNGDLTFTHCSKEWGIKEKVYSNGMAYADLDNDGDLELIFNNVDGVANIYKNNTRENNLGNYLKINFRGNNLNAIGIGSVVTIWHNGKMQAGELTLSRGYESSVEPALYFGLAGDTLVDSLRVIWPDGTVQNRAKIKANQKITLAYSASSDTFKVLRTPKIFKDITSSSKAEFNHKENDFNDFEKQVMLPHKLSASGPGIATGDINADGLTDFFVGNAVNSKATMYMQNTDGTFSRIPGPWEEDTGYEDTGSLLFDADGDGDPDLYVVSGGNEFAENSERYADRLYINIGKGNFVKSQGALPAESGSGSCVEALDFDEDGDLDLFVGGRHIPGKYPYPAKSSLLKNVSKNGTIRFEDVTAQIAPEMLEAGLVTSAFCTDIDGNGSLDIVVGGEWMPITMYNNSNGIFKKTELPGTRGWWFSINGADIDGDGDTDLVAGNLGLNMRFKANKEKTFDVFANDFDNNGTSDLALCYYEGKNQYPVRSWSCYVNQNPGIAVKFPTVRSFAKATIQEIYTKKVLENSLHLKAELFASCYFTNNGDGTFTAVPLHNEAQLASINDIIIDDLDNDGIKDVLVAGNLFDVEVVTPRNDAGVGLFLKGDGIGNFTVVTPDVSGFFVPGDVKTLSLIRLNSAGNTKAVLAGNNNGKLQVFQVQ